MNPFKKKINILYIVFILLGFFLFQANENLNQASAFFYGFAENKETEINLDRDVQIDNIHVTPGQKVMAGQLLMEVKQASIDFKINAAKYDVERAEIVSSEQEQQILNEIEQRKALKSKKTALANSAIAQLKTRLDFNRSLLEDLTSVDLGQQGDTLSSLNTEIAFLQKKLAEETEFLDLEIEQLEGRLKTIHLPTKIAKQKLREEIDYHKQELDKLMIYAPSDGLIGNIHCKKGEHIDAFTTLINFYERNPTLVKGFVHESLVLQVQEGDDLIVASSLHPAHQIDGRVIGLGSRIVEIPERLRKMPEVKTYGREVLIEIPATNPFLQKEKVMLNTAKQEGGFSLVSLLFPKTKTDSNPPLSEYPKE